MTDLVSLIKEAIMNAPVRQMNGKMDYQAMAEAAAKVAYDEVIADLTAVTIGLQKEVEAVRKDIDVLRQARDKITPPLT